MVTKLQEIYIGSHEEKLNAEQRGFDRDFWADSSNNPMVTLYRVHVKPRLTMFDPNQCATSPISDGVEILLRKTFFERHTCLSHSGDRTRLQQRQGCLVIRNRRSQNDRCVSVSLGGCFGTQGDTHRQRRDRNRLLRIGCTATLATGCDQVALNTRPQSGARDHFVVPAHVTLCVITVTSSTH